MIRALCVAFAFAVGAIPCAASDLSALARVDAGSSARDTNTGLSVDLNMTQLVPFRVSYLSDPYRVVADFNEVDFSGLGPEFDQSDIVLSFRAGAMRPGWSRLVLETTAPLQLQAAEFSKSTGPEGVLEMTFSEIPADIYALDVGLPDDQEIAPIPFPDLAGPPDAQNAKMRVLLDPGHGGIDPGAEVAGNVEADLMLTFARELKDILVRTGRIEVALTRDEDVFVPLEGRVSAAHEFHADVFISLHADVVTEGVAQGITIYTLSEEASDIASQKLAERHTRDELLAGVDLSNQGDDIALVLMDMARTETAHRTGLLAEALVSALDKRVSLYKEPRAEAGFSVLKSPGIPSVLIELGFMSSGPDLANLLDASWRKRAAEGLRDGLIGWYLQDKTLSNLRRQ